MERCLVGYKRVRVSHLQFANNTTLFLSEGLQGFKNVLTIFQVLEAISGMIVYLSQCHLVGVNIGSGNIMVYSFLVGCVIKDFPLLYIGVPET